MFDICSHFLKLCGKFFFSNGHNINPYILTIKVLQQRKHPDMGCTHNYISNYVFATIFRCHWRLKVLYFRPFV
jgi:hypothetical protein